MKKSSMGKARLADFLSCGGRCVNGCCELRLMQSACSKSWTDSTGPKESSCSRETGSGKAKAQRSISRSTKATKKSGFLPHVPTPFTEERFWYSHQSIRLSIKV